MLNAILTVDLTTGILLLLLGLLIFRERPRQRVNQITASMLFFAAAGPVLASVGLVLEISPQAAEATDVVHRVFVIWEFFFPQLVFFALVFPREGKLLQSHPRLPTLLYLPQLYHLGLLLLFDHPDQIRYLIRPETLLSQLGPLFEPVRIGIRLILDATATLYEYHEAFFLLINLLYVTIAVVVLHLNRSRMEGSRLQKQIQLIIWGIRFTAVFYVIAFVIPKFFFLGVSIWQAYTLTSLGLLIGAGTITWAIIRYHFLDIQFILRRGFIFSITSGILVAAYLFLYSEIKNLAAGTSLAQARLIEVLFLVIAIIAFQPMLNFFESVVDRIFYRHAGDYRKLLQDLSQEVLTILDTEELRGKIVNALTETLLVEAVHLWLPAGDHFETLIWGRPEETVRLPKKGDIVSVLSRERRPMLSTEILARINDPTETRDLLQLGIELLLPLFHRNEMLGLLTLGPKITRTPFSYEELTMLTLLADQLAISLENIQLYQEKLEKQRIEEEMKVAREIQQSLLTRELPRGPNFELYALNIPSREIGGDYFDVIRLEENRIGIAIGDVSGKGIPGAILMANLQAAFRAYALRYASPRVVVSQVNDHLAYTTSAEKYVTFFYGILECKKRKFTFTNAGHNYPLLCRKDQVYEIQDSNLIVGVKPGMTYHQKTIKLQPGDLLLFYTDGVTEAFNHANETFFGEHELKQFLKSHAHLHIEQLPSLIYEKVRCFTNKETLEDDLTIILLRIK